MTKERFMIDGKEYKLKDTNFPTIDPKDPYRLTKEEEYVVEHFKDCVQILCPSE